MKNIVLTQSLLTELERCDRSFIMSLYHRDKDNEHLKPHRISPVSRSDVKNRLRPLVLKRLGVTDDTPRFRVSSGKDVTLAQRVEETKELLALTGAAVIYSPMFATDNIVVGADLAVLDGNGGVSIVRLSAKNFFNKTRPTYEACRVDALSEVGPLLSVLGEWENSDAVNVYVAGINGEFNTPYPDPVTGSFEYDTSEALYMMSFDLDEDDVCGYINGFTPMKKVRPLMKGVKKDAEWIPDAVMGTQCQCSDAAPCPFAEYCQSQLPENHVRFYLPYHDRKKCLDNDVVTMDELIELSYEFPGLSNIPAADGSAKTWTLSETALRELQAYERLVPVSVH